MASVKKRPDGRWRARYRDADGREHAKHFRLKSEAERWLDEVTAAMVTGQYADPKSGRVTFREYAERWRANAAHGPSTRERVQRTLERHLYPALGARAMGRILASDVQAVLSGLPMAPSTKRVVHSYLVAIFRAAVRDRVIPVSPCADMKPPEVRRRKVVPPPVEVAEMVRAHLPERFRAVVDLCVGSGLRQGEVFGLEVGRVDFLRGRALAVAQQLVTLPAAPPYLGPPKTQESARTIPLAQITLDALAVHLAAYPAGEHELWDRTNPHRPQRRTARLVFTHGDGRPVARHDWAVILAPATRAAGLPPRTGLHALRHLYASLLIRHGESAKVVQERLGHASAAFTFDIYGHLWPDSDDRTRDAVTAGLAKIVTPADSVRTAESP